MQANLRGKLTREIEVKSCGNHFYKLWACNPDQLAIISPSDVQGCNLQEGEFGKNGAVIVWNYTHDGKSCVAKDVMENADLEERKITYRTIEGDALNNYKSFATHLQVTPKGDNLCLVKLTCEYEKMNEDVPEPTSFLDLLVGLAKATESHLKD